MGRVGGEWSGGGKGICDGREARPMAEFGGAGSGFEFRCRAKYLTSIV